MSERANYAKLGLFVIAGTSLFVGALIVLGATALFRRSFPVETYFEQSVQGLDVGAPVKFRGVQIGKVADISLVGLHYDTDRRYVLVRMDVFEEKLPPDIERQIERDLRKEIRQGLRVRLSVQGVTGIAYLEMDYLDPRDNPTLPIDWEPTSYYVPSAPSTITRLSDSVDRILQNLEQINVEELVGNLNTSLSAASRVLEQTDTGAISDQLEKLLDEIRQTNRRVGNVLNDPRLDTILSSGAETMTSARDILRDNRKPLQESLTALRTAGDNLAELSRKLNSASEELPGGVAQLRRALTRIERVIDREEDELAQTLDNLRVFSRNLRHLSEEARDYPSHVFFGEPPPRVPENERR